MLGLLGLIVLNTQKLSDHLKENIGFQVIFKDVVKDGEILKFKKKLDDSNYIKSTVFITKEEAGRTLQEDLGEDFISFLGFNPLLSSITVHLRANYANSDSLKWIEKSLLKNEQIKEVVYQKSLVSMVNENVKKISLVILTFTGLLMVIALALINNTIRLSIYSKRFLIKTMQLVGATRGFIRKPFVLKGIRHGIYASAVAISLMVTLLYFTQRKFPELEVTQDVELLSTLFALVVFTGILISWFSTALAVRKYLRLKTDELYY